jgi:Biopolymer transport protein
MADADTRPARQRLADKIDINMTPMIDIVFQLLAFFIMTLKIVQPEGDFDVRMPLEPPLPRLPTRSRSHRSASASPPVRPGSAASK